MLKIDAAGLGHRQINQAIRAARGDIILSGCQGQRFIAAGMGSRSVTIEGIPGNALGAYLNGGELTVNGNAQDAVGDTMNAGRIVIHGSIGDTAGYAMRGGEIYVRDNAGYRIGIHMKAYRDKLPVIVIGGCAGSFLGEYQAGGLLLVLGLHQDGKSIVKNFPCTGMHGGKLVVRSDCRDILFPKQVCVRQANADDLIELQPYLKAFSQHFGADYDFLLNHPYTVVTPDSRNPYKEMYVIN